MCEISEEAFHFRADWRMKTEASCRLCVMKRIVSEPCTLECESGRTKSGSDEYACSRKQKDEQTYGSWDSQNRRTRSRNLEVNDKSLRTKAEL